MLDGKARHAMSTIDSVVGQLSDLHILSAWTALYYALQPKFHFLLQHCYQRRASMDASILGAAAMCILGLNVNDALTVRRLRLLARLFGGGLRSHVQFSPAAFTATACRAVPLMIDAYAEAGERRSGFIPALAALLGPHSFDNDATSPWLRHLLASGCRLEASLSSAWGYMQGEVGDSASCSVLGCPGADAGRRSFRFQAALTRARERRWFQELDDALRTLLTEDARRPAWTNFDQFGTVWVSAWPSTDM